MDHVRFVFPLLIALALLGCAQTSDREYIPDLDGASQATGAAFTADGMHFRKPMPLHRDWRPLEFYYKHCSSIGEESYYSKTAYQCSEPY